MQLDFKNKYSPDILLSAFLIVLYRRAYHYPSNLKETVQTMLRKYAFFDRAAIVELMDHFKVNQLSFAGSEDMPPALIESPEYEFYTACQAVVPYLKEHDACLFIGGKPAHQIIHIATSNDNIIVPFIQRFMMEVVCNGYDLQIIAIDGVVSRYEYIEEAKGWKQVGKNIAATFLN